MQTKKTSRWPKRYNGWNEMTHHHTQTWHLSVTQQNGKVKHTSAEMTLMLQSLRVRTMSTRRPGRSRVLTYRLVYGESSTSSSLILVVLLFCTSAEVNNSWTTTVYPSDTWFADTGKRQSNIWCSAFRAWAKQCFFLGEISVSSPWKLLIIII